MAPDKPPLARLGVLALGLLLFGCGEPALEPAPPPQVAPFPEELIAPVTSVAGDALDAPTTDGVTTVGPEGSCRVELRYHGLSALHRSFFSDEHLVAELGAGLGACVADAAAVLITWDDVNFVGKILLVAELGDCAPREDADGWDLTPAIPAGQALARYRDGVAANYDYRVASFKVGLFRGTRTRACEVFIGGGMPPDGTRWDPCLVCDTPRCASGSAEAGVLRLDFPRAGDARYFRSLW